MPVTLVDRLPLPNLKVYTAGSVLLLSVSVYYALSVTGDPEWRVNATQRADQPAAEGSDAARMMQPVSLEELAPGALNRTRNMTEHVAEVFAFMMQEPLCMWTVINMSYCALALVGVAIQRLVFGKLRVSEAQRVKDKFWNYVFYKFIFVFGVVNVQYMDEVLLWCSWFTVLGFLQLLAQLCKDRFDYLSFSPATSPWAHVRLMALLSGIIGCSAGLLAAAAVYGLPAGRDTFAFMSAECILVFLCASHVAARYILQAAEADAAGPLVYYTHLVFDTLSLSIEVMHVVHMVVWSNMVVSMASLVLLMQLRHLLHALQARLRRHRQYTAVNTHMDRNYPMASKEEVEANSDNCAICWEPMKEARRLPCTHLFHNSCLSQWLQQDASCPTCRRGLSAARPPHPAHPAVIPAPPPPPLRAPNHLFHFDGSRYVSWLPSFSVEVTRVRLEPPPTSQIDAMARQVQSMFPHYPLGVLAADLVATRAVELTVDNILEGRLSPPPAPPTPPHTPAHSPTTETQVHTETQAHTETHAHIETQAHTDTPVHDAAETSTESSDDTWLSQEDQQSGSFGASSTERECVLRRRKERLVQSARRRYLARCAAPAPAPSSS